MPLISRERVLASRAAKGYNLTDMSKGLLYLLLFLLPLSLLPALEVYLNGKLWEHYGQEELEAILIPEDSENSQIEGLIPLREILPLMKDWQSLQIRIPAGDIQLEGDRLSRRIDNSYLKLSPGGQWQIHSEEDVYTSPLQIRLRGQADSPGTLTLWADPGVSQRYRPLLDFWAASHKTTLIYIEKDRIAAEILHRKMTGEALPDFTLTYLPPGGKFRKEDVISYQLRSGIIRNSGSPEKIPRLILPRGEKAHVELFLSLMAARFGYRNTPEGLDETARYYNSLLFQGIIREKNGEFKKEILTEGNYYFPAEDHRGQRGGLSPLPILPGWKEQPLTRVLPLMLDSYSPAYRKEALKAYLLHRGIQYSLFSAEERHLPALPLPELLPESYGQLLEEQQRGYILYDANYPLWLELERNLPALLLRRAAGVLNE